MYAADSTIKDVKRFRFGESVIRAINDALEKDPDYESNYRLRDDTMFLLIPLPDGKALVGVNENIDLLADIGALKGFEPVLLDSAGIFFAQGSCGGAISLGGGYTVAKRDGECS